MRAQKLSDLIARGHRVAVSNIMGREASKVCAVSQKYCGNIVGGWALGKREESVETPFRPIPVFGTFEELLRRTPRGAARQDPRVLAPRGGLRRGEGDRAVRPGGRGNDLHHHRARGCRGHGQDPPDLQRGEHRRGGLQHPGHHQQPRPGAHRGGGRRGPRGDLPPRLGHHHLQLRQHGEHHRRLPALRRHRHLLWHLHRQGPAHPLPAEGLRLPRPGGRGDPDHRALRRAGRDLRAGDDRGAEEPRRIEARPRVRGRRNRRAVPRGPGTRRRGCRGPGQLGAGKEGGLRRVLRPAGHSSRTSATARPRS